MAQQNPNLRPLLDALAARQADYRDALDKVLEVLYDIGHDETTAAARGLHEAIELVGCLRRLVPVASVVDIHRAFGAPGDFGYETPVGAALYRVYRTG